LGQDIADMRRCVEISRSWFPSDRADDMSRRAREYLSFWAFDNAESAFAEAELTVAFRQVYEGLKCSTSLRVMKGLRGCFSAWLGECCVEPTHEAKASSPAEQADLKLGVGLSP